MYDGLKSASAMQRASDALVIAELNRKLGAAEALSHLEKGKAVPPQAVKGGGQRENGGLPLKERESLLKLVIAMAVVGYRLDVSAGKSPVTSEIAGDLASVGLSLDPDTVRKYLREASELLPLQGEAPAPSRIRRGPSRIRSEQNRVRPTH